MIIAGQNLQQDGTPVTGSSMGLNGALPGHAAAAAVRAGIPFAVYAARHSDSEEPDELEAVVLPASMWREIVRLTGDRNKLLRALGEKPVNETGRPAPPPGVQTLAADPGTHYEIPRGEAVLVLCPPSYGVKVYVPDSVRSRAWVNIEPVDGQG